MIRELRLAIMQKLIEIAVNICPKDSVVTLKWFKNMPFDYGKDDPRNRGKEV